MGNFKEWIKRNHTKESFDNRFGMDNDRAGDYENDLKNITKLLMGSYHDKFMGFLDKLSSESRDSELEELIGRIETNRQSAHRDGDLSRKDKDEIVAPNADRGADSIG